MERATTTGENDRSNKVMVSYCDYTHTEGEEEGVWSHDISNEIEASGTLKM